MSQIYTYKHKIKIKIIQKEQNERIGGGLRGEETITCTESALIISPLSLLASSSASLLFPAPVGPEITITFCLFLLLLFAAAETPQI